jgi:uncharacterized damage-inducible protein DinB
MGKWTWTERKFNFDYPAGKWPDLLERVRGTPARIEERVRGLSKDVLTRRENGKGWSIQENIGHLLDLEYLHMRRIEEILVGHAVLVAADMTNRKTHEADHNAKDIRALLAGLRADRAKLVAQFEALHEAGWGKSALHPRLQTPMRIVDIAYFTAEHDDYHLARVGELIRLFS